MKISLLIAMLMSFNVFASNSYLLSSAFCDGKQISLFETDSDTDLSFKLTYLNSTDVIMSINAKVNQEDFRMTLNSRAPLKLEQASGDQYKIKADGKVDCKISANGKTIKCDKDSMVTLSAEKRVWTIKTDGPMKKFSTVDYTDEFNTCKKYELFFNQLSI